MRVQGHRALAWRRLNAPRSGPIALLLVCLFTLVACRPAPPTPTPSPAPTPTLAITPTPVATPFALPVPPPRDVVELHRRVNPPRSLPPTPSPGTPRDIPLGDEHTFRVSTAPPAGSFAPLRARLVAKTDHAYWYVEDGVDPPATGLQASTVFFEQHTYPKVQRAFGRTIGTGIDGDPRVTILIGNPPWGGVGGLNEDDLRPAWIAPDSNERTMIYVNLGGTVVGKSAFDSVVARSLALMTWDTNHPDQDYWVKLGTYLVAAEEAGVPRGDLLDPTALAVFALDPQTSLANWPPNKPDPTATLAASYLFARYVADRFGGVTAFRPIFAAPGRGVLAYDALFRGYVAPTTFDSVFADWVAANVLGDPTLDDGHLGYSGDLQVNAKVGPGPSLGQSIGGQASQLGATYYRVQPTAPATLSFTGDATVPLIAANPHSGGYEWWSNRGDFIDSRLTRSVDLRAVKAATLHYWAWFDLEQDADYAYVEVSTDGGRSWRTLAATDTTRDNPYGASLGDGFTGASGGSSPRWVPETIDLTPYAGRPILLRFEYVTDGAVQGDGFVVDDVQIPEIGFNDDASTDDDWTAEGFVRTDNIAPQSWLVEAISRDPRQPVRRLAIAPDGTGSLSLDAAQPVIVAVAGLAPESTQMPTYQLRLTPRPATPGGATR